MAKKVLDFDIDEHLDFDLIGVISPYKDFRLCFEINQVLNTDFRRIDDLEIRLEKKHSTGWFSVFQYISSDEEEFYIVANKGNHTWFVPEQKHIDFYILIRNRSPFTDPEELCLKLKNIHLISSCLTITAAELKSADNFLFIEPDHSIY